MRRPNRPLVFGDASDFNPSERVRMALTRFDGVHRGIGAQTPTEFIRDDRGAVLPQEIGRLIGASEKGLPGPTVPYHDLTSMMVDDSFGATPYSYPAVDDIVLAASRGHTHPTRGSAFPAIWSSSSDEDSNSSWGDRSEGCTDASGRLGSSTSTEGAIKVSNIRGSSINDNALFTENHIVIVLDMSVGALEVSSTGQVLLDRMHVVVNTILETVQQVVDVRETQYKQALEQKDKFLKKKGLRSVAGELTSLLNRVWHPAALVSLFIANLPQSLDPTSEEQLLRFARNGIDHNRAQPCDLKKGAHAQWTPGFPNAVPFYPPGVRVSGYGQASAAESSSAFVPTMQPIFAAKSIKDIACDPTIHTRIAKAIHAQELLSRRMVDQTSGGNPMEWPQTNIATLIERAVTVVPFDSNTSYSLAIVSNFANQSTPEVINLLRPSILAKGVTIGLYSLSKRIDWSSPDLSPLQSLLQYTGGYSIPFERVLSVQGNAAAKEASGRWLRILDATDCLAKLIFLKQRSTNIPVVIPFQYGSTFMPEDRSLSDGSSNQLQSDEAAERIYERSFACNTPVPMGAIAAARLSEGWSVMLELGEGRTIHRVTACHECYLHRGSLCLYFEATLVNAGLQFTIELRAVVKGSPHAVSDFTALSRSSATLREYERKGGRKQTLVAIYMQYMARLKVDESLGTLAEAIDMLPERGRKVPDYLTHSLLAISTEHSKGNGCSVAWGYRFSVRHVPLVVTIDEKCGSLFHTDMDQSARIDIYKPLVGQFESKNSPLMIKEIVSSRGVVTLVVKDPQHDSTQVGSGAVVQFFYRRLFGENGEDLTTTGLGTQHFALSNVVEARFSFLFVAVRNQASIIRHVMRLVEESHAPRESATVSLVRSMPGIIPSEVLHLFMSSYLTYQSILPTSCQETRPSNALVCNVDVFSSQSVAMLTWGTLFSVPCRSQREYQSSMHAIIKRRLVQGFHMLQYTSCGTWALMCLVDSKGTRPLVVDALHCREWNTKDNVHPFGTAVFIRRYFFNFPEVATNEAAREKYIDFDEDHAILSIFHSAVVMLDCVRTGASAASFLSNSPAPLSSSLRFNGGILETSFNLAGLVLGVGQPDSTPFKSLSLPLLSSPDSSSDSNRVCVALRSSLVSRLRALVVTLQNSVSNELAYAQLPTHLQDTFKGASRILVTFCKIPQFDDQVVILLPIGFSDDPPEASLPVVVSQFSLRTVSQAVADLYGYLMPPSIPDHQGKGRSLSNFQVNAAQALRAVQSMIESMYVVAHAAGLALQFDTIQKELLEDSIKAPSDPSRLAISDKLDKASLRKGVRSDLIGLTAGMSQYHQDIDVSFYSQSFHHMELDDGTPIAPPELEDLPALLQHAAGFSTAAPLVPLVQPDLDDIKEDIEGDALELVTRSMFLVCPQFKLAESLDNPEDELPIAPNEEGGDRVMPVSPCSPQWSPMIVRFLLICPNGMWWLCPGGTMKPIAAPLREQDVCTGVRLRVFVAAPPRVLAAYCRDEPSDDFLAQDIEAEAKIPCTDALWSIIPTGMDAEIRNVEEDGDISCDLNPAVDDTHMCCRMTHEEAAARGIFGKAGDAAHLDGLTLLSRFQQTHAVLNEDLHTLPSSACLLPIQMAVDEVLHRIALAALNNVRVACMHENSMRIILPSVIEPALRVTSRFEAETVEADVPCFYLPPLEISQGEVKQRSMGIKHMPFHQHLAGGSVRWGDLAHAGPISTTELKEQSHRSILELLRDYVRKYSMLYCLASGAFVFSEPQDGNCHMWALVDLLAGEDAVRVTFVSLGPRTDDDGKVVEDTVAVPLPEHALVRPIPRNLHPKEVASKLYADLGEAIRATTMKVFLQYLKRFREAGSCEVVIPKRWGVQMSEAPPALPAPSAVQLSEATLKALRDRLANTSNKVAALPVFERRTPSWMMGAGSTVLELKVHPTLQPRKLLHLIHNSRYLDMLRIVDRKGCFIIPDESEKEEDLWHYVRVLVVPHNSVAEPHELAPFINVPQETRSAEDGPQRYKIIVHLYSSSTSPNVRNAISDIADCYYGIAVADVLQGINSQQRREELSTEDYELLQRTHLMSTSQGSGYPLAELCNSFGRFHLAVSLLLAGLEEAGFRVCKYLSPVPTHPLDGMPLSTPASVFEARHFYLPAEDGGMGHSEFPITLNTCVDMVARTVRVDMFSVAKPHHAEEKAKMRKCQQHVVATLDGIVQELAFLKRTETPSPNHPLPQVPILVNSMMELDDKIVGRTLRSLTLGGGASARSSVPSGRINTCLIHSVVESLTASLHALKPVVVVYDSATKAVAPLGDFAWHRHERWQNALHTMGLQIFIVCGVNLWMSRAQTAATKETSLVVPAPKGMRQAGLYTIPEPVFEGTAVEGIRDHKLLLPTHVVPCRSSVTDAVPPPFPAHSLGTPAAQLHPIVVVRVRAAAGDVRVVSQGLADSTALMTTTMNVIRNALSKGRMFNTVLQQSLGFNTLPKVHRIPKVDVDDLKPVTEDNLARMCCGDTSKVRPGVGVVISALVTHRRASRLRFPPNAEKEYYEAAGEVRKALIAPPVPVVENTGKQPQRTPMGAILARIRNKQPVNNVSQAPSQLHHMPSKEALHQMLLLCFLRIIVQGLTNRGIIVNYCFPYDAAVKCLFDDGRRAVEDFFRLFPEGDGGVAGDSAQTFYLHCDAVVEMLVRSKTLLMPIQDHHKALYKNSRRILTSALAASKEHILLHVPNANVNNLPHDACVVHSYHRHLVRAHMLVENKAEKEISLHRALQRLWRRRNDPTVKPQMVAVTMRLQALSRLHYASRVPDFTLRSDTLTVTPELAANYSQQRVSTNFRGAQLIEPVQSHVRAYVSHIKKCFPHTFEVEVRHEDYPPGLDSVVDDRLCNRCGIVPVPGEAEPALFTPPVSLMVIPIRTVLNPDQSDEDLDGGVFLVEVGFNYVNYALDIYIPGDGRGISADQCAVAAGELRRRVVFSSVIYDLLVQHTLGLVAQRRAVLPGQQNLSDALRNILSYFPTPPRLSTNCLHAFEVTEGVVLRKGSSLVHQSSPLAAPDHHQPKGDSRIRFVVPQRKGAHSGVDESDAFSYVGLLSLVWAGSGTEDKPVTEDGYNVQLYVLIVDNTNKGMHHVHTIHEGPSNVSPTSARARHAKQQLLDLVRDSQHQDFMDGLWEGQFSGGVFTWPQPLPESAVLRPFTFPMSQMYSRYLEGSMVYTPRPEPLCEKIDTHQGILHLLTREDAHFHSWAEYNTLRNYVIVIEHESSLEVLQKIADMCHIGKPVSNSPVAHLLRSGPPAKWYGYFGSESRGYPVHMSFADAVCFHLASGLGRDVLETRGYRAHFVEDPCGCGGSGGRAVVVGPKASTLKGDLMHGPDGASRKRQASVPTYLALLHMGNDLPVGRVEVWREGYGTHKAISSVPVEEELECLEALHAFLLAVAWRGFQ